MSLLLVPDSAFVEFNPNHGPDGRFTSADFVQTVASWGKPLFGNPSALSSDGKAAALKVGRVEVGLNSRDLLLTPAVWIGHLEAQPMGKGHGAKFMQRLTALADAQKMTLALEAHPLEPEKGKKIGADKLRAFYRAFGFVSDPNNEELMVRKP
jgi:hypothetical protein